RKSTSGSRGVVAVALAVLLAASAVTAWAGPAPAAPGCEVGYTVNQWTGGFTAQVRLTNQSAAVTGWTLTWTFAGDQQITSAWSAQVVQSGSSVTATNASYNGALATGGSADFGFQATNSGGNAVPADFAFNGVSCGGS